MLNFAALPLLAWHSLDFASFFPCGPSPSQAVSLPDICFFNLCPFRTIAYSSCVLFGQKPWQAVSFRTKAFADCILSDKNLCRLYPFRPLPLQAVSFRTIAFAGCIFAGCILSDHCLGRLYPFGPLPLQAVSFRTSAFAGCILSDHCLCRLYPFGPLPLQAVSFRTIAFAGCILWQALFDTFFLSARSPNGQQAFVANKLPKAGPAPRD